VFAVETGSRETEREGGDAAVRTVRGPGGEPWKCRGCGKRGKPKAGFPLFPRAPWKFRQKAGEIPTFPPLGRSALEKWKTKGGFPTFPSRFAIFTVVLTCQTKTRWPSATLRTSARAPQTNPSPGKTNLLMRFTTGRSAIQLQLKTILNRVHPLPGFVYQQTEMVYEGEKPKRIQVTLEPHGGMRARCSRCQQAAPGYDRSRHRRSWEFVPLWAIPVLLQYAPRRVECPEHGVIVEHLPWSIGKRPVAIAMIIFLAQWARRMSWRETARSFRTSWEMLYRSVEWFVEWGLDHRVLEQVHSIGVDEIHWGRGKRADNYLTVIYQIDQHCRRLLWVGRRRTQATLRPWPQHARAGSGERHSLCVQRHVEALPERIGIQGWPCSPHPRPLPYQPAFEPSR
jgi:Transposase